MMKASIIALAITALAPARAHAKGCHEVSHVVGYEKCSRFGMWSREEPIFPFHFEMGWLTESFATRQLTLSSFEPRTTDPASSSDGAARTIANGMTMRWLGGTGRVLYFGVESDVAWFTPPAIAGLPEGSGNREQLLGVIGAHASLWRFTAAAELAAGGGFSLMDYCGDEKSCGATSFQGLGIVEGRVRADWFVAPRFSLGVAYGHSLIDSEQSLFVTAGIHLRALDGMY